MAYKTKYHVLILKKKKKKLDGPNQRPLKKLKNNTIADLITDDTLKSHTDLREM